MSTLISVIVPVYNGATLLPRCLEHLINQTYQNLEIIIVDDGSTDNTPQICKEYASRDSRITVIKQKNSGPADARNNGLKHASGEYVHFHDADDFVRQDYYEKMMNAIKQSHADVICGEVEETGFLFPKFNRVIICQTLLDKIAVPRAHQFNVVWRYLYRRDFLTKHKIQYPHGMFIGEDKRFMMRATYHAKTLATAPGAIYHCMDNPDSLGKNFRTIMRGRSNGKTTEPAEYLTFMETTGMTDAIATVRRGIPDYSTRTDFLGFHIWRTLHFIGGDKKYYFLGIPILTQHHTQSRIRFYLFGLYLLRLYTSK